MIDMRPGLHFSGLPSVQPIQGVAAMADVAVIMRTKNRPLLLHRALASVALQSYRNWRLYLVNDGGDRDALEDTLRVYLPVFGDRMIVIHHETSKGMEAASNAGLARGKEDFVVIHDDDDSWHPDFLARSVAFLSNPKNAGFVAVTTHSVVVTEVIENDSVRQIGRSDWDWSHGLIDYRQMLKGNRFPPICMLFRRSAIGEIGPLNAMMPVLGDWDFNIRLMRFGDIGFIPETLANYHHRVAGTNSAYSNTVVDGRATHEYQNRVFRNALLRETLQAHPELTGVVQAVMMELDERHQQLFEKLDERHQRLLDLLRFQDTKLNDISLVASWHRKMLRPLHWFWLWLLPVRTLIARTRGRV
jgi:glycosyltransferase involved in cell wall biosynthesis